ncbi:MAG TPA: helix-turn-helix transcriptional regulator [Allosphingosinicella sp.]
MKSRLRVLRAERGWTQEQLGAAIGVSRQAINAIEAERHDPSLDLAYKIAAAFGVTVEHVFPNPHQQRTES